MEIYLIRHAQTQGNLEKRYIGRTDEPLCETALRLFCNRAFPFVQKVFVSPMKRCIQTAQIIYPMVEQVVLEDLRECDFGAFENKAYDQLKDDKSYRAWIAGEVDPPEGESQVAFRERCCKAFLEGLSRAISGQLKAIAFVAHGGTIMSVLERFAQPHREFYGWQVENLSGWKAHLEEDDCKYAPVLTNVHRLDIGG